MSDPGKQDISAIFKRLRSIPTNKACFDCSAKNPSWASITYGVFLCIDCSGTHRSLGVHLTFIRSTELDFNWSWYQIRSMQVGGNASAMAFFAQHGCTSNAANTKYNSRAALLYREKIKTLATQATRRNGTELWLDCQAPLSPTSPVDKQEDFFSLHIQAPPKELVSAGMSLNSTLAPEETPAKEQDKETNGNSEEGPRVDALSVSPKATVDPSSMLKKKPAAGKKTLGSKKGGLGAQKVSSQSFSELEKRAQAVDKLREVDSTTTKKKTPQPEEPIASSLRLAYKDLEEQRKRGEEKMKGMEGKKKEQAERLGMGLGSRSGVSHSVTSDMHIIEQESPVGVKTTKAKKYIDEEENEGSFTSRMSSRFDDQTETSDKFFSQWGDAGEGGWRKESTKAEPDFYLSAMTSSLDDRITSRRKPEPVPITDLGEARKKFGDVKAISSDMYFGKQDESDYEAKTRLERLSGNSSISSADLFDDPKKQPAGSYRLTNVLPNAPDMSQLKLGVRNVAGRLSVMASGVVSSIQDHYST
ncbi:ADP-ribosylation factor GTPase-activating protein 3 isoform X1 [Osmerus eperlanus]|uniref:ADP-ribosylation factor GTPase-activating protein 3 isoform X1 n=1 Tax=Osmerus eperlanus TaxID=29151 RepID=UPI002E11970C